MENSDCVVLFQIEKDGTFSCPDGYLMGGRSLLGLGSLLLKARVNIIPLALTCEDMHAQTI